MSNLSLLSIHYSDPTFIIRVTASRSVSIKSWLFAVHLRRGADCHLGWALPKKLASLVDRSSCFRFPAARESLKCSRKGLRRYSATRTDQKPFFVILDKTQKKFPSMPVQRDREIVSKKLLFLSSPVEVEADESLARANRKSGLLNSLPVLLLPDADLEAKANHRALTLSK
uniref:Uncharacterized protein n=1 Tax=Populus alba TaxID=43335 RepID=A0A4U5PZB6_POPAL|nr:hypothetical protein D5086_0000160700 [Populus alba]